MLTRRDLLACKASISLTIYNLFLARTYSQGLNSASKLTFTNVP